MSVARDWPVDVGKAWSISLVGTLFTVAGAVVVWDLYWESHGLTFAFFVFTGVGLPLVAVGAGPYVSREPSFPSEDVRTVRAWMLGTVLALWALYGWWLLPELLAGASPFQYRDLFVLYGNLGLVIGLVAGMNRARARQNRRLAERAATQQDTLEFINHLLRHNVLNGLQVVDGYAGFLGDHVDDEGRRYLRQVRDRSDHMTDLIGNVRVLMRTLSADADRYPVDCSSVLLREVDIARAAYPDATFETDLPEGLRLVANDALGAVFENLLSNAVLHSDHEAPHVRVSARTRGGEVVVRVADDGPGIPDEFKQAYLSEGVQNPQSTGDGLGLYLVDTLVGAYGGTVTIEDNDPRGTVVVTAFESVVEDVTRGGPA